MDQTKSMKKKENKDDSKVWGQKTEKKCLPSPEAGKYVGRAGLRRR